MCQALFSIQVQLWVQHYSHYGTAVNKTNALPSKCLCSKGEMDKKSTSTSVYMIPKMIKKKKVGGVRELGGSGE